MHSRLVAGCVVLVLLAPSPAWAQAEDNASEQPSIIAPLAAKSLLIDVAEAGPRLVTVGERGHILVSVDQGATWTQVQAPGSSNLTAVYFVDARHGWAVGHDELILRTEDGGDSWQRVHYAPENKRPLLDVWFANADHGLAVGAYGAMYASEDGGRTWAERTFSPVPLGGEALPADPDDYDAEVDMGFDFHLNAIVPGPGSQLYMAAEAGRLFRSDDEGRTWRELPSPYDGSFYGILPLDGDALLAFGLRGNLFRSEDGGMTWRQIETSTTALLNSAIRPAPDTAIIAGLNGVLLVSADGGRSFAYTQQDDRKALSSPVWVGGGEIVVAGEAGVRRLAVPGLR